MPLIDYKIHSLEQKYVLRYMIETWNKRDLRSQVASDEVDLARFMSEATRQDVLAEGKKSYYNLLASARRVELRKSLVDLADTGFSTVSKKAEAGDVSNLEKVKARVERSRARIALKQAQRRFQASRQELASSWGAESLGDRTITGTLSLPEELSDIETLQSKLSNNPVLKAAKRRIDRERASHELAQSRRIPNVTVGGGYKQVESTDDYSYIVNISLPFPLFDRNQGNIQATKNRIESARQNYQSVHNKLLSRLKTHHESLTATYQELTDLKEDVLPGARRAYEASLKGFKAGKFDYLEVLDAQRTFFENRIQYVESLKRFYQTKTEIERLTATVGDNSLTTSGSDSQ
jgi:cobalt-zinc-cadmium efflux system outer membrane protein